MLRGWALCSITDAQPCESCSALLEGQRLHVRVLQARQIQQKYEAQLKGLQEALEARYTSGADRAALPSPEGPACLG
jgi:hypothetical protein